MRDFHKFLLAATLATAISAPAMETRDVPPPPKCLLYASAKSLERQGKFADAKSIYRMALHNGAAGRSKREAFLGLARCEEKSGDFWAAFLAVESSYPTREELLGMPAEQRGKELARRAKMETRYADALAKRGHKEIGTTLKDGKKLTGFTSAAAVYHAVVFNNPQSPATLNALIERGDCLRAAGEFDEAEKSYRMLINTFPGAPEVEEARISLAGLLAEKTAGNGGLRGREERETTDILRSASTAVSLAPEVKEKLQTARVEINENKAQALLDTVKKHYAKRHNSRDHKATIFLLNEIIDRYPRSAAATEAAKMLAAEKN
jgi:outer membrane protein assembly factor BamD (BamD/ComL family)